MISFIAYLIQKFENDNIWLVEKLTELGNENEALKTKVENLSTTRETQKQELDAIFRQVSFFIYICDILNLLMLYS